jgi:outer membrane cobalamin receptor
VSNYSEGGDVPLLPRQAVDLGITWIHPSSLQVTLAAAFAANRPSNEPEEGDLKDYASLDLTIGFEPFRKHLALQLSLVNILDRDNEVAEDIAGPARTVLFGATVRF